MELIDGKLRAENGWLDVSISNVSVNSKPKRNFL
jgi:hypothetical protein